MIDLFLFLPEIYFLSINLFGMISSLILQVYFVQDKRKPISFMVSWVILLTSIFLTILLFYYQPSSLLFAMTFKNTLFLINYKIAYLFCSFILLLISYPDLKRLPFQYVFFCFIIIFGGLLLIGVNDYFVLYLVLEFMTFGLISYFGSYKSLNTIDATIKYFILSAFFSMMFLYGASLIYGITGTLNFTDLRRCALF